MIGITRLVFISYMFFYISWFFCICTFNSFSNILQRLKKLLSGRQHYPAFVQMAPVLQFRTSVLNSPTCKFGFASSTQYSKFGNVIQNIQNKLGHHPLKCDLKLTLRRRKAYTVQFCSVQALFSGFTFKPTATVLQILLLLL